MITVYLAGPFRGKDSFEVNSNVQQATVAMYGLIDAARSAGVKVAVICPHSMTQNFDRTFDDEYWLAATMELMYRCDVLLMLPGWENSKGAKLERKAALAKQKLVFDSVADLTKWARETVSAPKPEALKVVATSKPVVEVTSPKKRGPKPKVIAVPTLEGTASSTPVTPKVPKKRGPKPKIAAPTPEGIESSIPAAPKAPKKRGPKPKVAGSEAPVSLKKAGRPPASDDLVLEAIRQHLDLKTPWPEIKVPGCSGPTAQKRYKQWQADGVWDALLSRLDALRKSAVPAAPAV
jgi:hypothetical protein